MEGQEKVDVPALSVEVSVLGREVASMSENITDLLRSRNDLQQELATARESATNLTNRLETLEWYIAGLVAKNCLLQPETKITEKPEVQAGESHSADAVA